LNGGLRLDLLVPGKKYQEIWRGKQGYFRDISPFLNVAFTFPVPNTVLVA